MVNIVHFMTYVKNLKTYALHQKFNLMYNCLMKYTIITINGADAEKFLQGMLTCDVTKITDTPTMAASCNRKGRVIANFWLHKTGEQFKLKLPASIAESLIKHLKKFVFISKVQFSVEESAELIDFAQLIEKKTPLILPETSGEFTPQMLNLEKLGGVSFTKGCYLGQEIVARTEHLGKLKRHLHKIELEKSQHAGDELIKNNEVIGRIVNVSGSMALAVIQDDPLLQRGS